MSFYVVIVYVFELIMFVLYFFWIYIILLIVLEDIYLNCMFMNFCDYFYKIMNVFKKVYFLSIMKFYGRVGLNVKKVWCVFR